MTVMGPGAAAANELAASCDISRQPGVPGTSKESSPMKTAIRNLAAGIAVVAIAALLLLAFDAAGTAFSPSALAALVASASRATLPSDPVIPLQSIADLDSLNATIKLDVNGLIDGERTQGDLTGLLTMDDQNRSRITVSGGLLGDLAAKVGGSMIGLFTPSKVDLYKTPEGAYIVVNGLVPICIKPKALNATAAVDEMSPQGMLSMLTSSDVARGKLVGEETLNGARVKHYVIDGDAFLAAAQKSTDEKLRSFGESLWSADDAHVYVDTKTGYPVAFRGSYSGAFEPLKFEGDFSVDLALTGVNTNSPVNLPSACNKPISQ
jgi:hypothetical protein